MNPATASMPSLQLVLAQLNPTVGDPDGNAALMRAAWQEAKEAGADLVVFPELSVTGYPPEDLVLRPAFLRSAMRVVETLATLTDDGPGMIVGAPIMEEGVRRNAVLLLDGGKITHICRKRHLPNYGVFDEVRVFSPGKTSTVAPFRGFRLGLMVCEDMWFANVARDLKTAGAEILVVPNGSPFEVDKRGQRIALAEQRVAETGLPLVYVNQVGGQDELVFDGGSFVLNADGGLVGQSPQWVSHNLPTIWSINKTGAGLKCAEAFKAPALPPLEEIYRALVVGLADYVGKNGFPGVIIGLSGGIDSALSAAVAVDALGADKVRCVMMPSPYTSQESLEDAEACARYLGVRYDSINIGPAMAAFEGMLGGLFEGRAADVTEENIQARARGISLMALSNKFGHMVLSTGNKSEMSVGYATLYGDMCGGYSVLKDVYKTTVFALCRWRNGNRPSGALGPEGMVMPDRVITKPPSAELRPDQKDSDSLPDYPILDHVLGLLIEEQMGVKEAAEASNQAPALVERIWGLLHRAEYKRRQAPPGVKITRRSFGRERRYPITNRYRGQD